MATFRHGAEFRRSQTTISYGIGALTEEEVRRLGIVDPYAGFYSHMLTQDVSLWVMPVSVCRDGPAKAVLEPSSQQAEELLAQALRRGYYSQDLGGAIYDFFHQCAATMVAYGYAPYEIVYLYPVESDKAAEFELFPVYPPTLLEEEGRLVQYVPQQYAATDEFPPRIQVEADRLLVFEPPRLCRESLADAIRCLAVVDRSRTLNLALESFQADRQALPYDFLAHKHAEYAAVAEATKDIGWDARGSFREVQLEYYQLYRQLVFMQFVIRLRESILETLNKALAMASQVVVPLGQLRLEGLPTSAHVEDALKHLESGDRPFRDILAPFLLH